MHPSSFSYLEETEEWRQNLAFPRSQREGVWETKFNSNQEEAQILDLFIPLHVIQTSKALHLMWRGHWNLALCTFLITDQF